MFGKNIKIKKLSDICAAFMLFALIFLAAGCGDKFNGSVLESNRVVNMNTGEESGDGDDTSDYSHSDKHNNDKETTGDGKGNEETSDRESGTEETASTTGEPVTSKEQTTVPPTQPPTQAPTQPPTQAPTTTQNVSTPAQIKINQASPSGVTSSDNGYVIDYGNANSGYIMVKGSGANSANMCIQIYKDGENGTRLDQYVGINSADYVTISLTGGNGNYYVRILESKSNGKYAMKCAKDFSVNIVSQTAPYIYPTYIVNFNRNSAAVNTASNVCAGCTTDEEKVQAVRKYVIDALSYDYSKAEAVKSGQLAGNYVPNVDSVLASGKGICYDYSALFAAMLRCQGIPVRLVKGYPADGGYHAWNEAYYNGSWHLIDCTYEDGGSQSSSYTVKSYH